MSERPLGRAETHFFYSSQSYMFCVFKKKSIVNSFKLVDSPPCLHLASTDPVVCTGQDELVDCRDGSVDLLVWYTECLLCLFY